MRSAKMLFFPNSRDGHSYGLSLPFPGAQRAVMESIFILSPFIHCPNIQIFGRNGPIQLPSLDLIA